MAVVFFHMLASAAAVGSVVAAEGEMPKLLNVLRTAGTADGFQIAPAHAQRVKKEPRAGLRGLKMNLLDVLQGKTGGDGSYLPGRETEMKVSEKHFVTKNPMKGPWPEGYKVAVFANGCFWGSEKGAWRLPGVYSTAVGYAAGFTPNPTYEEACSGRTGSTEAVQVVYDPKKLSFADILRWFWQSHDPTQGNRQGNDRGTQYRSGFYYFDDEQKALIEASKAAYEKQLGQTITTEVRAAADFDTPFYYAEDYHQQYLAKPMARPYCSAQPREVDLAPFEEWAPEGFKGAAPKLPEKFWDQYKPKRECSVVFSPNEQIVMDE